MLSVFVLQRDPRRVLCPWGRVTLSHTGGCTRRRSVAPLRTWLNGSTKWRETGRCGLLISPYQPGPRYSTIYRPEHTFHTSHTVIYYSNKSLAPPNFLWISISLWTYLHWSTSGVRMCQASLSVTLKNGSQISVMSVCACTRACLCVCVRLPFCVCVRVRKRDLCRCSISVEHCHHRQGFRIQILESE